MKKLAFYLLLAIAILGTTQSCKKEKEPIPPTTPEIQQTLREDGGEAISVSPQDWVYADNEWYYDWHLTGMNYSIWSMVQINEVRVNTGSIDDIYLSENEYEYNFSTDVLRIYSTGLPTYNVYFMVEYNFVHIVE